jgi:sigma-B regulation protein RsbU (phosphoserine phosphatase)
MEIKKTVEEPADVVEFEKDITLNAAIDELETFLDWMAVLFEFVPCSGNIRNQIVVAAEEIFVNIAKYAYNGKNGIVRIRAGRAGPALVMQFVDSGVPFNPLERADPNINAPLEDRAVGGLGLYIVKKWMDSIRYERVDGENRLTIQKDIAGKENARV